LFSYTGLVRTELVQGFNVGTPILQIISMSGFLFLTFLAINK
jgi:hypothetical protein